MSDKIIGEWRIRFKRRQWPNKAMFSPSQWYVVAALIEKGDRL